LFWSQADSASVSLTTNVADDVPTLDVDPARIRQVISNLLSNAIHHTPSGGSVNVAISSSGDQVTMTVTDTGEGIPPELLPHVFERFVKGPNSKGSGLGLAIVHDIIRAHGGEVEVENRHGRGTVVRVRFHPN
jgi:signal transduction histidine kinase